MKKTCVELFAGVGGFRCGLNKVSLEGEKVTENGNWEFLWANQWEPSTKTQDAYNCYGTRFGFEDVSNVDIFEVDKKQVPDHTLLVGGFPCQDYSVAQTLSNSKGIEGKKGVLWWAIEETLAIKQPPFVLLENVDRLLLSPAKQRGRDFGIILRSFYENGYDVQWRVINAGEYGLPQKRRRTYIFAYHKSTNYYKEMQKLTDNDVIFEKGLFVKQFPIENQYYAITESCISEYKDLIEVSNNFKCEFYNAGIMHDGGIYTVKTKSSCKLIHPLRNIREEIGLIKCKSESTGKEFITAVVDGAIAENYKFLKNDILTVSIVLLVDKIYNRIGIKHDTVEQLKELVKNDKKTWDIYAKGYTLGVNQCEQPGSIKKMMRFKAKNISELAAWIASIRPSFKSMYSKFESREPFNYGIPAH